MLSKALESIIEYMKLSRDKNTVVLCNKEKYMLDPSQIRTMFEMHDKYDVSPAQFGNDSGLTYDYWGN